MSIEWPESLLTEIAERRCVIVLGAGASASSCNDAGQRPSSWTEFLEAGIAKIASENDRDAATELLKENVPLDAAQVLADALGAADFAHFIRQELVDPGFQPSELHELIVRIDPKIVITTNYDNIYESLATSGAA